MQSLTDFPSTLPVPIDDGACDHLLGAKLPSLNLFCTDGKIINFSKLNGRIVVYLYPMTGRPDIPLPNGWNEIPGARGCTPQSCSFRDHHSELQALNTAVYGLSTQDTEYQKEAAERLHLPFPLVSDGNLEFINALSLPTMGVEGMVLTKRITLIVNNGVVEKYFYPVFPPNENVNQVIGYLKEQKA